MIDDPHDGEVTGIRLTASSFTGGGATDADHPVSWFRTDRINSHLLGAAVLHHLKMLVLEIRNAVGGTILVYYSMKRIWSRIETEV